MPSPRTLYDKIIDRHRVMPLNDIEGPGEQLLLYVDRTVLNEYTSPQAFAGLRAAGRKVRNPSAALMVVDHVNSTAARRTRLMPDADATRQVDYFAENARDFGIEYFDILDPRQGIEHVVIPEQGMVMPGMVIAAGDSHATAYGAFGALGFGIGTSDIEHQLATSTVRYRRLKTMRVQVQGDPPLGITPKDIVIEIIRRIGADGATGYAVEFAGPAVTNMSVEGRIVMSIMAVEAGARGVIIAPDQKVLDYLEGRPRSPKGEMWNLASQAWLQLRSDQDAIFDRDIAI